MTYKSVKPALERGEYSGSPEGLCVGQDVLGTASRRPFTTFLLTDVLEVCGPLMC